MPSSYPLPLRAGLPLCLTVLLALLVLGLSFNDLGRVSLYFNPSLCGLSVLLSIALFTTAIRHHDFAQPTPTVLPDCWRNPALVLAILVLGLAFLATNVTLVILGDLSHPMLAVDFGIKNEVIAQCVFGTLEALALVVLAGVCYAGYCDRVEAQVVSAIQLQQQHVCAVEAGGKAVGGGLHVAVTVAHQVTVQKEDGTIVSPDRTTPRRSIFRKSRPPTWNHLSSFAAPFRRSLLPFSVPRDHTQRQSQSSISPLNASSTGQPSFP